MTPYQILQVSNVTLNLALKRILGTDLLQFDIDSLWLLVGVKEIAICNLELYDDEPSYLQIPISLIQYL